MSKKRILFFALLLSLSLCFAGSISAQSFQLNTENYPPFNMENEKGEIIGISTEIVEALFKRANVTYKLSLLPWQRAYKEALEIEGYAVFSTTRTPEREPLFKWVGPIIENNWVFLKRSKNRHINIKDLDAAKRYRIGGYHGDAIALFLEKKGFSLDYVAKDYLNVRKLDRDRIDLWATGHLLGPYYAKENDVEDLEVALVFKETIMSIAFNSSTSDAIIDKLNAELRKMEEEGVLERIKAKYR